MIGVIKDYHLQDIHNSIDPTVLLLSSGEMQGDLAFAVRYNTGNLLKVKEILTAEFDAIFPKDPFEFNNMETAITNENSFKIYMTIKQSIIFFTVFIILLAIIALLGMVSYSLNRRVKEIGIRKINGSSVLNLFLLLNREYLVLLGISLAIALSLSHYAYVALPGNFKISLPIWIPFVATFFILIIIIVSTGYQTYKAAKRNPLDALRYE